MCLFVVRVATQKFYLKAADAASLAESFFKISRFCYSRCRAQRTRHVSLDVRIAHTGYRLIHDLACADVQSANADRYARWQTDRCTTTYVSDAPSKDAREKLPGARGNVQDAREDVQDARENLQDARENLPTSLGWWMNSTASRPAIVTCHADDR